MKVIWNLLRHRLVWLIPTMFGFVGVADGNGVDVRASVSGRYSDLLLTIHCPNDVKQYGEFKEYGYRAGESWCGYTGVSGYLVWVNPNWYVWRHRTRTTGRNSRPYIPGYDSSEKKSTDTDCRPVHAGIVTVLPCR